MVNDVSIELDNVIMPVYKGRNKLFIECEDAELRTWAYKAMEQYDLVISPPHKNKKYIFVTCLELVNDKYRIDTEMLIDSFKLFFDHYPQDELCVSTNILNKIDEYIETEIYDTCSGIEGMVNFYYGHPTIPI